MSSRLLLLSFAILLGCSGKASESSRSVPEAAAGMAGSPGTDSGGGGAEPVPTQGGGVESGGEASEDGPLPIQGGGGGGGASGGEAPAAAGVQEGMAGADAANVASGAGGASGASAGAGCQRDEDCPAIATDPSGCAEGLCDANSGDCIYVAVDGDADGFRASQCQSATPGVAVESGEDCDDSDSEINPTAWDGPADNNHDSGCGDGLDNDCSGSVDDGRLGDGSTCECSPGTIEPCATTASGAPIVFPLLDEDNLPLGGCRLGTRACRADSTWGACEGAVGPAQESCAGEDSDCDGVASIDDVDAMDALFWSYDADNDGFRLEGSAVVRACSAPTEAPTQCLATCTDCDTECPLEGWKGELSERSAGDCDDNDILVNPGIGNDGCNGIDDDCDGIVDPGCSCVDGLSRPCGIDESLDGIGSCRLGTQQCLSGLWGLCSGHVAPESEICGIEDRDCDGLPGNSDPDALDMRRFVCDADGDGSAATGAVEVMSCSPPPTGVDTDCDGTSPQWLEDPT